MTSATASNIETAPNPDSTGAELTVLAESKLTERYQTTLPASVRKALALTKHDRVAYCLSSDGQVYITRLEPEESDPVLAKFAKFLAENIEQNPQNVKSIDPNLLAEAKSLVAGMNSDFDAPLSDEDEDEEE